MADTASAEIRRRSFPDLTLPPKCRATIRRGAAVAISTSGGEDSQAMTILLSRLVPRDRLVAVHAPLREVAQSTIFGPPCPRTCR